MPTYKPTQSKTTPLPFLRLIWKHPLYFIAFGFGSGLLSKMPGTWGTVVAIPIYLIMAHYPLWLYGLLVFLMIVFAVYTCGVTAHAMGIKDYPGIVLDEIVGFLLTLTGLPVSWLWIVLGFILFRVFDICKPWPISWLNRAVPGGLGIVADDVLAAIFSWFVLQGIKFIMAIYN